MVAGNVNCTPAGMAPASNTTLVEPTHGCAWFGPQAGRSLRTPELLGAENAAPKFSVQAICAGVASGAPFAFCTPTPGLIPALTTVVTGFPTLSVPVVLKLLLRTLCGVTYAREFVPRPVAPSASVVASIRMLRMRIAAPVGPVVKSPGVPAPPKLVTRIAEAAAPFTVVVGNICADGSRGDCWELS